MLFGADAAGFFTPGPAGEFAGSVALQALKDKAPATVQRPRRIVWRKEAFI